MSFPQDAHWPVLRAQAVRLQTTRIADLLRADGNRAQDFALRLGPLYASFARQRFDREALACLHGLARDADYATAFQRMLDGEAINRSEERAVLHTALRGNASADPRAVAARAEVEAMHTRMRALYDGLHASDITDIVSVGIGGSDLGPRLVVDALSAQGDGRFRLHFINNVDGGPLASLLPSLDPDRTAVLLISKSFGTQETLLHAKVLQAWLGDARRAQLFAVTARPAKAAEFGVDPTRCLPMWDWVGGRFSLWSSVGFPIALALGIDRFEQLLQGAAAMDSHVRDAPIDRNLAIWHALSAVWNRNALGLSTHAILAYDERLRLLPDFLQQLWMESLGKSARGDGMPVPVATSQVVWGGVGTSTQHSFFQALHQGARDSAADFIGVVRPAHDLIAHHQALLANLLAQSEAFALGEANADLQRDYPGDRPNSLLLLDELTPYSLGMLIALYEHSVFFQAQAWGVNAFDQWGVELGKRLADGILPRLQRADGDADDAVTRAVLAEVLKPEPLQ